jgi:hypothetical protein
MGRIMRPARRGADKLFFRVRNHGVGGERSAAGRPYSGAGARRMDKHQRTNASARCTASTDRALQGSVIKFHQGRKSATRPLNG